MKIIKRGTKPPGFPWIGHYLCPSCRSIIELAADDHWSVKDWKDDQRDGMSVKVDCPVCEQERWLMGSWVGKRP